MNLLDHFQLALRTWLEEVFSEEPLLTQATHSDKVEALLREAQAALNVLQGHLAQALSHHQQVNVDRVQALSLKQALVEALDDDRRAGLRNAARAKQTQLAALNERVQLLQETVTTAEATVLRLQTAVEALQFRLDQARKRRTALTARGQLVELLMELDRLDRELARDESLVQEGLQAQETAVRKKEDRLTAREEWKLK